MKTFHSSSRQKKDDINSAETNKNGFNSLKVGLSMT